MYIFFGNLISENQQLILLGHFLMLPMNKNKSKDTGCIYHVHYKIIKHCRSWEKDVYILQPAVISWYTAAIFYTLSYKRSERKKEYLRLHLDSCNFEN